MSVNTRSCATDRAAQRFAAPATLATIAALVMAVRPAAAIDVPPLPAEVIVLVSTLKAQGGGELTFFGISVYDGYFWSPRRGFFPDGPLALDLHYHRALDGAKIAERSADEIAKLGYGAQT